MDKQWKVAPADPTYEMSKAGGAAAREYLESTGRNSPSVIYRAMLAAAPQPPIASDEREAAEVFAFASTNEPSGLLRHWWRKGYDAGRAALATTIDVDAAERKPVTDRMVDIASAAYEREVLSGATHEQAWHVALRAAIQALPANTGPLLDPHSPTRHCMCTTCRPSFDNGADDPVRRYGTRGGGNE